MSCTSRPRTLHSSTRCSVPLMPVVPPLMTSVPNGSAVRTRGSFRNFPLFKWPTGLF